MLLYKACITGVLFWHFSGEREAGLGHETHTTGKMFFSAFPRGACLAIHAHLALAFARLKNV